MSIYMPRCVQIPTALRANVETVHADLAELEQVRSAAQKVRASSDQIDCLLLNAGALAGPDPKGRVLNT
jgi:NAD(P)-dependent dehydrogenase (short-subunit alcohol dehydrogenase family)